MLSIVFATNNAHKLSEIKNILNNKTHIVSLNELGCFADIPETGDTLEENASQKSHYIYERFQIDCFADDTGLEIEALSGEPGVYSARYAGEGKSFADNMALVLKKLKGINNRKAAFRTVISLILDGKEYLFEGKIEGTILEEKHGIQGFGYDPIFMPNGYSKTFAQLSLDEKNKISHRALAVKKLVEFLNKNK